LPAKPVIITFDDGFADQMQAFALLKAYQMKATFYIIDGGPGSQWCIGAGRRYNDPSQPPSGCGDAYLTWDQVRQLDASGLITIGSHTIDHPDLPTETAAQQEAEIAGGKAELEAEIGHKVTDFAYPYGDYNQTTINIVKAAGFLTAVTTTPGTLQPPSSRYTLDRIRSTYDLP
jgi:peptidoglycan/xylan/chitin deacetylase (PgdA/CDA1 family)